MKRLGQLILVMILVSGLNFSPVAGKLQVTGKPAVAEAKTNMTKAQAKKKLIRVLKKKKLYNKKYYLDYDYKKGNCYVFHYYEWVYYNGVKDHTATTGWYSVNRKNGRIRDETIFEYLN